MIKLVLPVNDIRVTQGYAKNYLDFYKKMGLKGHQGTDFSTVHGTELYAMHNGIIRRAKKYSDGGIGIMNWNVGGHFKTFCYHLKDVLVKAGDTVKEGQIIGHCDNTGKYTTGDHLHAEFMRTDDEGVRTNRDNGYWGCEDITQFFPKDWEMLPVMKGYGQVKTGFYGRDWRLELKNKRAMKTLLGRRPFYAEIMAFTYGGWKVEDLQNPSLKEWLYITKQEMLQGRKLTVNNPQLRII